MNSLVKLAVYIALGDLLALIVIVFLPLLILFWVAMMLLDAFFGIKMIKFHHLRPGRPHRPEGTPAAEENAPHVPASEDVIDAEAVDLPDEPVSEENRLS